MQESSFLQEINAVAWLLPWLPTYLMWFLNYDFLIKFLFLTSFFLNNKITRKQIVVNWQLHFVPMLMYSHAFWKLGRTQKSSSLCWYTRRWLNITLKYNDRNQVEILDFILVSSPGGQCQFKTKRKCDCGKI